MNSTRNTSKAPQQHPSDETLSGLAKNLLAPEDTVVVQQHVSRCKRCQSVMDELRMENSIGNSVATEPSKLTEPAPSSSPKNVASKQTEPKPDKQTVSIPIELRDNAQYKVLSLIGRGGMGNVFLVEHKLTARKEVLKVIHSHLLSREDVRVRFKREIQSAAKLNHPNVVQTLTAIEEGRMIGLVMEYVKGESLSSMVNRVGPLPIDRAREFIKQIAMGLDHAHQQNMVHRDIKPQNVLVSKEGDEFRVRILDFGLAKTTGLAAASSELTIDGAIIGTPNYMAPEQAINPSLADIRSDIYSLGCTWFFLLTGRSPFEADSPLAIMNAHQNSTPPPVHSLRLGVPYETEQILSRMLAKNPDDRFQSPAELIAALASSKIAPLVEKVTIAEKAPLAFLSEAQNPKVDLSVFSPMNSPKKTRRKDKKEKSKFATLLSVVMFSIPPIALVGILMFRPHWITDIGGMFRNPGQASIVLASIPADVQVFINDAPARFERPRAEAQPCISANPGTYKLSARRNEKEIFQKTVTLVANQILELDLGLSIAALEKPSSSTRPADVAPQIADSPSNSTKIGTATDSTDMLSEPSPSNVSPFDIDPANPTIQGEEVVLGKRFVVNKRLSGHSSPVIRVSHLSDGKLISAERVGKPIQLPGKPVGNPLQSTSQISLWSKEGNKIQSLPSEGTLDDFLAAPNGMLTCHVGRVFGAGLTAQLYNKEGRSIWKSDPTTMGQEKPDISYFAFSPDSGEFLVVSPQGNFNFTRMNLKTGKIPQPVTSLINIDKSSVKSLSVSQKLDCALFGLWSGDLLAIRTKDGKQISKESSEKQDSPKTNTEPIVATQFNSKDNRIAALHSDGTVQYFEFPSMKPLEDLPQTLYGSIRVMGRSNDGRFLAAIDDRLRVSVYDLDAGNLFASWELAKAEAPTSISIDNLGKRIAIGSETGSIALLQPAKE
ncbi:MAG: serine/threonine-protein kinase [Planctomycetota bacterium]|nr:serine/threonine-protein kinase [Planctomycetota bacterium]